jgi:hypothetical protein
MNAKLIRFLFPLVTLFLLSGCSLKLTIHQPADNAVFTTASTITLEAEVRGGEQGCGGEDCNCADWWWTSGAVTLGLDQNNGQQVSYCRYSWTLPASTLGVGNHTLIFHGDQGGWYHESTKSVVIKVQP